MLLDSREARPHASTSPSTTQRPTATSVLTDRTDVLRKGKWETSFWVRGTFEVRDGRITLWDDAFSWARLHPRQPDGADPRAVSADQHSSPSSGTVPSMR